MTTLGPQTTVAQAPVFCPEYSGSSHFIPAGLENGTITSNALSGGGPQPDFETETHVFQLADLRKVAHQISIDREGFALLNEASAVEDWYDDQQVEECYYPEVEAFVTRLFDATRIVHLGHRRRVAGAANTPEFEAERPDSIGAANVNYGAHLMHTDLSARSAPENFSRGLGQQEFDRLQSIGARLLRLNVWRPMRGPILREPLALGDASSFGASDLIGVDQIFGDRASQLYLSTYSPRHRWYFVPEMRDDEVLVFKNWDTLDDGRAKHAPHGAFIPSGQDDAAPARESIELRVLVVVEPRR